MMDAANYAENVVLKNGLAVQIRAVRADDKGRISEAFRNLEAESIYTRFFHHKKALSEAELKAATEVDFDAVVALVVTTEEAGTETIIAASRFVAFDTPDGRRSAEVAFTVEEDYHGQGIATHLLRHLVTIAREKGIAQFEADVLPQTGAMLAVFSRGGLPMTQHREPGSVHVVLSLTEASG